MIKKKLTEKQLSDFLAYRWRTEEALKEAEEREKKGLPPLPKPKRAKKGKLTPGEMQIIKWAMNNARNEGIWGDFFTSEKGETEVNVVDSEFQKLDIRVGPVFRGNKMSKVPGIWIAYQDRAWLTSRLGDFLMSPTTFFEIVEDALEKIAKFNPGAYRLTKARIKQLLTKTKAERRKKR